MIFNQQIFPSEQVNSELRALIEPANVQSRFVNSNKLLNCLFWYPTKIIIFFLCWHFILLEVLEWIFFILKE